MGRWIWSFVQLKTIVESTSQRSSNLSCNCLKCPHLNQYNLPLLSPLSLLSLMLLYMCIPPWKMYHWCQTKPHWSITSRMWRNASTSKWHAKINIVKYMHSLWNPNEWGYVIKGSPHRELVRRCHLVKVAIFL